MSFQINSSKLCLTYSNINKQLNGELSESNGFIFTGNDIDDTCGKLWEFISSGNWGEHISIKYLVVGREYHKSGDEHYHVALQLDRPIRTRNSRFFDLDGFHPNVQSAKDFNRWVAYVKKEGTYAERGTYGTEKKTVRISPEELIILAQTMNKGEFLSYCSVNRYQYAVAIWEDNHKTDHCTLTEESPITGIMNTCLNQVNEIWDKTKTLLLVGDSGIGKTTWCKINMPKPCLMVTHLDDLKRFEPGVHTSILFDDVSVKHLPDTSQIHLVDHENPRSIHIRYGVARIPSGIIKAFTCNTIPVNLDMDAIARRCQFIKVTKIN